MSLLEINKAVRFHDTTSQMVQLAYQRGFTKCFHEVVSRDQTNRYGLQLACETIHEEMRHSTP